MITPSEIVVLIIFTRYVHRIENQKLIESLKVFKGLEVRFALDDENVRQHQSEASWFLDDLVPVRAAAVNRP